MSQPRAEEPRRARNTRNHAVDGFGMSPGAEPGLAIAGRVVVPRIRAATGLRERFLGLMGRAPPGPGAGLWLSPCKSIHTCFMRFAIDVVFLDPNGTVLRVVRNVRPWRLAWAPPGTRSVVELESGWLPTDAVQVGARAQIG